MILPADEIFMLVMFDLSCSSETGLSESEEVVCEFVLCESCVHLPS